MCSRSTTHFTTCDVKIIVHLSIEPTTCCSATASICGNTCVIYATSSTQCQTSADCLITNSVTSSDSVTDNYAFLKEKDIPLRNIRLFYNTNSLSARINIPSEFDDVASCDEYFHDDILVRKWNSMIDYLKDRAEEGCKRFPSGRGRRRNWNNDIHVSA